MNIKSASKGLLALLAGAALLGGPASADILTGEVYQVGPGDVYIKMADSTVARVPMETAKFTVDGVLVPGKQLSMGQQVVADYTPVYGFQRFYHTSEGVESPTTVYIIRDLSPDDISVMERVEWDGRVYRVER
jgi:hypothetical protein